MKFDQPNGAQKIWREEVRAHGSCISFKHPCEIHHPIGRTAKADGLNIGHWFVLALTHDEHNQIDRGRSGLLSLVDEYCIYHPQFAPSDFEDFTLHEFEKFLWLNTCRIVTERPFPKQVALAIEAYHR